MLRRTQQAFTIVLVLFLLYSLSKNIFSYTGKLQFYHDFRKEYEKEYDKNKKLKSELRKSTDYYTVEKEIREKLNLLQPDEEAIILPKITITLAPSPTPIKKPYQQWIDLVTK